MEPTSDQNLSRAGASRVGDTLGDASPAVLPERALEALVTEIRSYLALVDLLRAEGCEPRWA